MAYVELDTVKLKKNYNHLKNLFEQNNIKWSIVTKLLCGTDSYLREIIDLGIEQISDARVSNLAKIKAIKPEIETIYIKPPAAAAVEDIVRYADITVNTEFATIKLLAEEAKRQNKVHKVLIMIELGDLREGIMGENLMDFYAHIFQLDNIEVVGIGANLNCLHGVMPSEDKLIQLCLYKQLIEAKFNRKIPYVSGGTSVVIPLIDRYQLPKGINHFRVGEMLYFGNNLVTGEDNPNMEQNLFKLHAQIIEITEKPKVPIGALEANPSGEMYEINEDDYGKKSFRAILDIGLLDVSTTDYIIPDDETIELIGASSDMLIIDLGQNKNHYKTGDMLSFNLKYMGALRLLNSFYVEKRVKPIK